MPDSSVASTLIHTGNHTPPIGNLDNYILWYIFSLNADMNQQTALLTLRYTSQVCSSWRELAVGSPSLWSRILNLNELSQGGANWRNEVIRRTGTALLHIKASCQSYGLSSAPSFLEWLLKGQWTRIQSLELSLVFGAGVDETTWWRLFERPAPALEVFNLMGKYKSKYTTPPDFALFSNTAPSLRSLSADNMKLDLNALRTPKLRHLVMYWPLSTFDLLSALRQMPLLETLMVPIEKPFTRGQAAQDPLPKISLPQLRQIKFGNLIDCVDVGLSFLANIIPSKGCALDFFASYKEEKPDDERAGSACHVLSTYLKYYPRISPATDLTLISNGKVIIFIVDQFASRRFFFGLENKVSDLPDHTVSNLLSAFSTVRLGAFKTLSLSFSRQQMHDNMDIKDIILAFVSVEEMTIHLNTLWFLRDILLDPKVVPFPVLKTVHVDNTFTSTTRAEHRYRSTIADFIKSRIQLGCPLTTLYLKERSASVDVKSLKTAFPGLTIVEEFRIPQ